MDDLAERDYEAEAAAMLRDQLLKHSDPNVRLLAMTFEPPPESVARVAAALKTRGQGK